MWCASPSAATQHPLQLFQGQYRRFSSILSPANYFELLNFLRTLESMGMTEKGPRGFAASFFGVFSCWRPHPHHLAPVSKRQEPLVPLAATGTRLHFLLLALLEVRAGRGRTEEPVPGRSFPIVTYCCCRSILNLAGPHSTWREHPLLCRMSHPKAAVRQSFAKSPPHTPTLQRTDTLFVKLCRFPASHGQVHTQYVHDTCLCCGNSRRDVFAKIVCLHTRKSPAYLFR